MDKSGKDISTKSGKDIRKRQAKDGAWLLKGQPGMGQEMVKMEPGIPTEGPALAKAPGMTGHPAQGWTPGSLLGTGQQGSRLKPRSKARSRMALGRRPGP